MKPILDVINRRKNIVELEDIALITIYNIAQKGTF